jgi:hypothetical protein
MPVRHQRLRSLPGRYRGAAARALAVLAALATLGFPGCSDSLTGPGGPDRVPERLASLWPNDDGRTWTFRTLKRPLASGELLLTPIDRPLAQVTLADARRMLRVAVPPGDARPEEYAYGMQFRGNVRTRSGVEAQNLYEWFPPMSAAGLAGGVAVGAPAATGEAFLARVAEARPDLRGRLLAMRPDLRARLEQPARAARDPWPPILVHGYAWRLAPRHIGAYGDADTLLAWKFLESDVRPGHEFHFQLLPLLADDLWLSASVERELALEVPGAGLVRDAIEVLYLVDYGDAVLTDGQGNARGHFRTFDYGTVVYAPGVGPVSVVERRFAWAGGTGTLGTWELDLSLLWSGVPAREGIEAWGRVP